MKALSLSNILVEGDYDIGGCASLMSGCTKLFISL